MCPRLFRSFLFPLPKQRVNSGEESGSAELRTTYSLLCPCCGWQKGGECPDRRLGGQGSIRKGAGFGSHRSIHYPLCHGCDSGQEQMPGDWSQGQGGSQSYCSCVQGEENPDSEAVSSLRGSPAHHNLVLSSFASSPAEPGVRGCSLCWEVGLGKSQRAQVQQGARLRKGWFYPDTISSIVRLKLAGSL